MKFLIYGGKGWIGRQVISLLKEEDFILSNVRVDSYKELEKEIKLLSKRLSSKDIVNKISKKYKFSKKKISFEMRFK